ncbi:MAG: GTP 3',8-cyclase MoaA [Desulfovibrio sp.]|nr:GTP 3',8-cyclase MoaA [Desulfovibrio sp.]
MSQGHVSPPLCLGDAFGRSIQYLRLSVTDRCNLRCSYCQSNAVHEFIPHEHILHYEEILRFVNIVYHLGIEKVRLTGGEPFVRKGCAEFLWMLRQKFPSLDIRITSNGTLLAEHVTLLKRIRVGAVNLSLDSFDAETFATITGRKLLPQVLASLEKLLAEGVVVKINAVALRGITEREIDNFLSFANTYGVDVRFIEFMPMGRDTLWNASRFCPVSDLLALIEERVRLQPCPSDERSDGPARMFSMAGRKGRIGVISPLSNHFCHTCNRLRLTSEGALRLCLFDDHEYPLRPMLCDPTVRDEDIAAYLRKLCQTKPLGYDLLRAKKGTAVARSVMSGIGG